MNATRIRQFVLVVSAMLVTVANSPVVGAERPNVVVIMTDNHGAWTLGCYGNDEIRSPNIDRLAREGTLFTRAFACNPVCSPTRASFLTGLMPSQHGVHCFLSANRLQLGPQARSTMAEFQTLPEILKAAGYSCGLVGKWHLGDNLRPQEGFDDYWITMPHGGTSTFYDAAIIENGKVRKEPEYLTDFWTRHAVNFIDAHAAKEQPFFLFLSYNGPYALSRLLLKEGKNRHAEYYRDKPLESFPREPAHPWQYNNLDFHNNPTSIRRVATEVSGVDDGVGRVLDSLQRHGVDDKTIVLFLADQGWVGGHGGFFGMGDHTRPVTARDGMMRIPMIWRFPSKIAAGRRTDAMAANYDCLPTLLAQLGLSDQAPAARLPGRDLSADLDARTTSNAASTDRPIFYEFEELRCVRTGKWKYVHRHPNGPHELYNLTDDPDERVNLVGIAGQQATRRRLKLQLDEFFGKHRNAKYDLWSGGGSQTRLFVGIDEELAQEPPAPPPPLAAGFTPVRLRTPEGFVAELAAGPPLVAHPTMACLDDRGRLFVAENAGVNMSAQELEKELPNSVRMLEDTDGDGRYDRSTVFADRMTFPMGGVWKDGALFVASPPNIWRLEDTDGDRVADKREVIVDKFGYTGNAASVHGCFAGPDGRIYWCDGRHGHEFRDEQGKITSKLAGSYIFSCLPDGSDVRIHCGGGMDNPVEIDFTDEGDVIGTVNIMYTRPRVDCLVHWQHGGAYPHSERVLGEFRHTGGLLGPIHRFGHVAISGVTRYRSGVLDHQFQNNMFAAMFNSGRVVRLALQRSGSTYAVTEREFVSSANRDFHPTDVLEDADGSLLIVDTGGWFYRGCPTSQLSKPDVLGGIYRVRRRGMTAQIDPLGKQIAWDALSQGRL
ncbi:MAG: sulfatase-like hydrolase/transferase, partial [Pirellulaceae bacterium]|nr:sulfatase-like hydrolase/transferase [Pirellulaceae bacterium]